MTTRKEKRQRLEELRALKLSGANNVSVDGVSVQFNHKAINEEIAKLEQELGERRRRPRIKNINLN